MLSEVDKIFLEKEGTLRICSHLNSNEMGVVLQDVH